MLNLATILEASAVENPEKEAIIFMDRRITYQEINGAANAVANALLEAGIQKGDKVALMCPNLPYFPIAYYGILKAGAVVVPLNVLLKEREIAYHLNDSNSKAFFCFEGTPELPMAQEGHNAFKQTKECEIFWIMPAVPDAPSPIEGVTTFKELLEDQAPWFDTVHTDPNDTAVILYTSGTTGLPKGAELSHTNLMLNAMIAKDLSQGSREDSQLVTLPLFHSFAQTVQMNAGFLMAQKLALIPRFNADDVFKIMEVEEISIFCGVPTMYWELLMLKDAEKKFDLKKIAKNLRICASGGASLPVEIIKQFEEKFEVPILEGYGLSETSPICAFNKLYMERKPGSIGTPVWGVEAIIVDKDDVPLEHDEVGELVVRGPNVMKGYYNRPEETEKTIKDGWFYTGDMAKMDEDGYYYIVDRIKDMIIRGGYNVYPREIEEVLLTHPAVSLAAVIGTPHETHGEDIKAFIILKEGAQATSEEIIAWSKENMANYKYPREVEIRDELPLTATGKVLKRELKD
ncbi:MAG: long-chain fatty acid--CoA ligase [Deltaproteobacteria bacterium]|nr:long-chain fatty acid--CoA ligase [Deltaproteobacteria bacterium]